ncbi:hypothetical protein [Nocardia sp. NPDC051570]|uniref:hypothetical protein n=1 Tax=Nocardia sp. NPDC051570 TaxID=3364324 RepID=UPI0037A835F7
MKGVEMHSSRLRQRSVLFAAIAIVAGLSIGYAPAASADDGFAPGTIPLSQYSEFGPHETAQTLAVHSCDSVYSALLDRAVRFFGNQSELTCTDIYPSGNDSQTGIMFYYPKDIAEMSRVPSLIFSPGSNTEPGYYDSSLRFWASYGYVIAVPYDLVNLWPELPLRGAQGLAQANSDPKNVMFGKLDLGRTILVGHSGGGQATELGASVSPSEYQQIDPALQIIGEVPIEPGPIALGSLLNVPTLYLTGCNDAFVWHWGWPRLAQYNLTVTVPAYLACIRGANHTKPMDSIGNNPFAPITLAWMQYIAKGDQAAAKYFVGSQWSLPADPGVEYAMRNDLADRLPG